MLSFVKICAIDKNILLRVYNSSFADMEDAVQYYSAGHKNYRLMIAGN